MGGVQTLIFLSQSGNDEVKVSDVGVFEKLIIQTFFLWYKNILMIKQVINKF